MLGPACRVHPQLARHFQASRHLSGGCARRRCERLRSSPWQATRCQLPGDSLSTFFHVEAPFIQSGLPLRHRGRFEGPIDVRNLRNKQASTWVILSLEPCFPKHLRSITRSITTSTQTMLSSCAETFWLSDTPVSSRLRCVMLQRVFDIQNLPEPATAMLCAMPSLVRLPSCSAAPTFLPCVLAELPIPAAISSPGGLGLCSE